MRVIEINGDCVTIEYPYQGCVRVGQTVLAMGDFLSQEDLARILSNPVTYYNVLQTIERQAILKESTRHVGYNDEMES